MIDRTSTGLEIDVVLKYKLLKILFLHGWHSVVGGVKPTFLIEQGNEVLNPKLDDDDWGVALATAQAAMHTFQPDVIVGSSRGGAIAMNLDSGSIPLVLLCPAWKRWGNVDLVKPNTLILHSRADEVIPLEDSEDLIRRSKMHSDTLIEVGTDHRLADHSSLSVMHWACQLLGSGEPMTWLQEDLENTGAPGRNSGASQDDASYICDACGEEIVIPLDLSEGTLQRYVEDCPVCCRANIINVQVDDDGQARVWAEPEQDYE